jgi:WD40 repeat protein
VREIAVDTDLDTSIVFAEDDKTIALPQHGDRRIALIDVATPDVGTRRYLDPIGPDQAPWGLAVDPSGKTLFATYTEANGEIHVWDLATRKSAGPMGYTFRETRDPVAGGSLSVSRDGRWLATSGGDKYIRVYDIRTKSGWRALPMDSNEPYTVAFSPDGTKLAALAADNRVYVWSLREDGAERYASFNGVPDRTRVADREARDQRATWLAWVTNDSIALATGVSAINVIGLDPGKWQRRIDGVAPVGVSPVN